MSKAISHQLSKAQGQLDKLIRDVSCGVRGPDHYHDLEQRAQQIAASVIDAFRKKGAR